MIKHWALSNENNYGVPGFWKLGGSIFERWLEVNTYLAVFSGGSWPPFDTVFFGVQQRDLFAVAVFEVTMFCLTCDKLGVPRPVCVQNDYSLNNRTFDEEAWNVGISFEQKVQICLDGHTVICFGVFLDWCFHQVQ